MRPQPELRMEGNLEREPELLQNTLAAVLERDSQASDTFEPVPPYHELHTSRCESGDSSGLL